MASGPLPPGPEVTFLLQLTAIRETGEVTATIKTDALETGAVGAGAAGGVGGVGGVVELFLAALRTALATFQPW
ncbi:hypothetical protein B484DRAFT_396307 [Ochromonadaceae sp. CCMP2298]|nr:hypothetical protein B484DRAFT_396307 [Ochromonadaceae sp. CCMP2298]